MQVGLFIMKLIVIS